MTDRASNVTLIWAQDLVRHAAFLRQEIAGIDFDVMTDLTGLSEDEIASAVQEFDRSPQVTAQFKRLVYGIPIGSFVVAGAATGVSRRDRRWSIGQVVGGYEFRLKNPNDRHTIKVEWFDQAYSETEITRLIGINPSGRRSTVTPLSAVYNPKPGAGSL